MMYVLYGPDTFRSRKKMQEIIQEYRNTTGATSDFWHMDAEEQDLAQLKNFLETQSLFQKKKLAVVENLFSSDIDLDSLENVFARARGNKDIHLVVWDRELNEKKKAALEETKHGFDKVQEFRQLSWSQLKSWITNEARVRGISLSSAHANYLLSLGADLALVSNELEKIALVNSEQKITMSENPTIFHLGDTFFASERIALHHLFNLLDQGQDDFTLFAYLANHARTLFAVKFHQEKQKPIPSTLGINPYVARKAEAAVRSSTPAGLFSYLNRFFEEDYKIKIGLSKPRDSLLHMLLDHNQK